MLSKLKECQGTRVILVRHGQSSYNALGLYQGSSDESVLTEVGRSDARKTGNFLKGLAFDAIYSSSLKRAHETAKEILGVIAPDVDPETIVVTDKLRETDMAAWEGLAFQYVRETFPEEYRTWKQRPHEFCMEIPPNLTQRSQRYIYPALDLYERVQQFWQEVLPRYVGKTLLVVTHGGTNRALISTALGITPERYHCIQQSNCGISVLHFPDGSLESGRLEAMNLTAHVEENLPKLQEGGQGLRLLLVPSQTTHPNQAQQLAQLLKGTTIHFTLSEDMNKSQAIAQQINQYHSETLWIVLPQQNSPEAWLQAITKGRIFASFDTKSNQLLTGLVVASVDTIKRIISQAIGMTDQLWRLELHPGTVNFLHYPDPNHLPVLQALNVSGAEKELICGSVGRILTEEVPSESIGSKSFAN